MQTTSHNKNKDKVTKLIFFLNIVVSDILHRPCLAIVLVLFLIQHTSLTLCNSLSLVFLRAGALEAIIKATVDISINGQLLEVTFKLLNCG